MKYSILLKYGADRLDFDIFTDKLVTCKYKNGSPSKLLKMEIGHYDPRSAINGMSINPPLSKSLDGRVWIDFEKKGK